MGGGNCWYPTAPKPSEGAVRPAGKLSTDWGVSSITAACVNSCLSFFCEKDVFSEASEDLRLQKHLGF